MQRCKIIYFVSNAVGKRRKHFGFYQIVSTVPLYRYMHPYIDTLSPHSTETSMICSRQFDIILFIYLLFEPLIESASLSPTLMVSFENHPIQATCITDKLS